MIAADTNVWARRCTTRPLSAAAAPPIIIGKSTVIAINGGREAVNATRTNTMTRASSPS